jgi:hypothetical protein
MNLFGETVRWQAGNITEKTERDPEYGSGLEGIKIFTIF